MVVPKQNLLLVSVYKADIEMHTRQQKGHRSDNLYTVCLHRTRNENFISFGELYFKF